MDYYPFIDIKTMTDLGLEQTSDLDGASDVISIPVGLPFGTSIHTKAYVCAAIIDKG